MAETTEVVASPTEKKTKKTAAAVKKPKVKPTHPPTSEMVTAAIKTLKERGGSSLPAIKKYLAANYKVDVERLAPFIKKYLKGAVVSGALVQTKGKGASGSFKLSKGTTTEKPKATKKAPVEKKKKVAPAKKTVEKKVKKEKPVKAAAKKAPASPKKVEKKKAVKAAVKTAKKTGEVKVKAPAKAKPVKAVKAVAPKAKVAKPTKAKKVASPAKKTAKK